MLKPGDTAPEFALANHLDKIVTLSHLLEHGRLVLFFYPADFTPVCTREVCLFRDVYNELAASGISVAGVSPDDTETHARFRAKHEFRYPLLSDPEKLTFKAYGIDGPLGIGVRRATFLIDQDHRILAAVRADLRLTPHKKLVAEALKTES